MQQAADRIGVSRHQIVQLIEAGALASHREGWHLRIDAVELASLIEPAAKPTASIIP